MKTSAELVDAAKGCIAEIDVEQLAHCLQDHHAILIDVREHDEYAAGHIDRAVNYPRGVLEMKLHQHPEVAAYCEPEMALAKLAERPIYLICRSGARSALAAQSLKNMGFEQVYSVAGGMQAWQQRGFSMEKLA